MFDENYKVLDMGWQLAPATTFTKQKLSFPTLNVKEAGYIFVYLSYDNDSNNWVYFDDLKVTHTQTNILQYNEYYPFGLQTASSWTREGSSNNYLYNEGSELNGNSGWYETFFRGYDPTLGRFHQIDPLAHEGMSHTPYHYGYNDPVYYNDPSGARPIEVDMDLEVGGGGSGQAAYYDYSDAGFGGYSPGPHQYGQHFMGAGSGNHWSDRYRSAAGNFAMMSLGTFQSSYDVALNTSAGQSWFANNVGTSFGGGLGGLTSAMASLGAVTYDAHTFTYQFGGNTYGGIYHTTNGEVTSAATGLVRLNDGGWEQVGPVRVHEFGGTSGQNLNSPNSNDPSWLNLFAAEVTIWGGATTISVNGPKPTYTGAKAWASQKTAGVKFGRALGATGLVLTGYDMYTNGVNTSNALDATFGVVSFAGPIGAGIGGLYFVSNLITVGITGKTIGQHVDDNFYIVPTGGLPGMPFIFIPKK